MSDFLTRLAQRGAGIARALNASPAHAATEVAAAGAAGETRDAADAPTGTARDTAPAAEVGGEATAHASGARGAAGTPVAAALQGAGVKAGVPAAAPNASGSAPLVPHVASNVEPVPATSSTAWPTARELPPAVAPDAHVGVARAARPASPQPLAPRDRVHTDIAPTGPTDGPARDRADHPLTGLVDAEDADASVERPRPQVERGPANDRASAADAHRGAISGTTGNLRPPSRRAEVVDRLPVPPAPARPAPLPVDREPAGDAVEIHIGRIEVRLAAPQSQPAPAAPTRPVSNFDRHRGVRRHTDRNWY